MKWHRWHFARQVGQHTRWRQFLFYVYHRHRHHLHHHLGWCLCCISCFVMVFFITLIILWRWMLISVLKFLGLTNWLFFSLSIFEITFHTAQDLCWRRLAPGLSTRRVGLDPRRTEQYSECFFILLLVSFHQYSLLIFHASPKLYDLSNSQRGWIKHFFSSSITIWISNYVVPRQLHFVMPYGLFYFYDRRYICCSLLISCYCQTL